MRRIAMIVGIVLALPAVAMAQWIHTESEDLMAGTVNRMAVLEAEAYQGTLSAPALVVRVSRGRPAVYVYWGGYSMDPDITTVAYRFGDEAIGKWRAAVSTNWEALFLRRVVAELLQHEGDSLVIQAARATGVTSVARFDLTGITEALAEIDVTGDL